MSAEPLTLPTPAAQALSAAGSPRLGPGARAELDNRIAAWGVCAKARNIGGILCGSFHKHGSDGACVLWRGRYVQTFPDYDTGARRLVRLVRLASGEAFAPGSDTLAGFRSVAPDRAEGEKPLQVEHLSGAETSPEEKRALFGVLVQRYGEAQAAQLVNNWRRATPGQRDELRETIRAELGAAPDGGPDPVDLFDTLAGLDDETGAAKKKAKKKAKKPSAAAVVKAKAAAKKAKAAAKKAKAQAAALRAQLAEQQAQAQADAQAYEQQAQEQQSQAAPEAEAPTEEAPAPDAEAPEAAPQGETEAQPQAQAQAPAQAPQAGPPQLPPAQATQAALVAPGFVLPQAMSLQDLKAKLDALDQHAEHTEKEADKAEKTAGTLGALFGPSDANAAAFQDAAASWVALKAWADAHPAEAVKVPGLKASSDDWQAFADAWRRGDNAAAVCNGGQAKEPGWFDAPACENGLNARIHDLERLRKDLATVAPDWAAKVPIPKPVELDARHPVATTLDRVVVAPIVAASPALAALTAPDGPIGKATDAAQKMATGKAPGWYYAAAGAVVLGLGYLGIRRFV